MDTTLRARIRAGDEDAFGHIFDQYSKAVYNHAFRLVGNWATAEDVMALTFLEAWKLRTRIDVEGGSLRPWLLGIATNTARNMTRSARRRRALLERLPVDDTVPDFADDAAGRMDDVRTVAAVQEALAGLRRTEREVIALCVWAELDYAAAAEALGVPVGTVRSRLFRARKKLRRLTETTGETAGEPAVVTGQVKGGRASAVRLVEEGTR